MDHFCPHYMIKHECMHNQTSNKLLLNPMSASNCMISHHVPCLWNCSGQFGIFLCSACFDQSVWTRAICGITTRSYYNMIVPEVNNVELPSPCTHVKRNIYFYLFCTLKYTHKHARPYTLKPMHSHTKKCCVVHIYVSHFHWRKCQRILISLM